MADQKIELEIVLDDGSIKRAFGTIRKEAEDTSSAFKLDGLADLNAGLELVKKGVHAVGLAIKEAFDLTLAGEQIDATAKRFEILSQQANLSASAIESGIAAAVGGTVDLDDAIGEASKAIVTLGAQGKQIPQIFELARKASQGFGGTTLENFEKITQAIATQNTRALKNIGIIIDSTEAQKSFAKSIGAASDGLNEAGQRQAILNAVLLKGNESFKNINASIAPLQEASDKLGVSFKGFEDTIASLFNKYLSGFLQNQFKTLALSINDVSNALSSAFLNKEAPIEDQIAKIENKITRLREMSLLNPNLSSEYDAQVAALEESLVRVTQRYQQQEGARQQASDSAIASNAELLVSTYQLTDAMLAQNKVIDDYEKLLQAQTNRTIQATESINKAVQSALVNGISQSVLAMVKAIAKGENALSAVGKTILGVFGDLAIQTGTILIGIGIGIESLKTLSGFAAIAAGIGLVAVGGVLKALSGGEGSNAGVTSNGGGVAFNGTAESDPLGQSLPEDARESRGAVVNFTVQGDILDSDQTSSRIVELLNSAIDTKGAVVRGFA